ncbi:MAG: thioredoxin family protein [Bacteroidota bacterium]
MIKVIRIFFLLLILIVSETTVSIAGSDKNSGVNWMTPAEFSAINSENKKPIIVDVYTNWCYYCKVMDKTTWKNDSVAAYLGANYFAVKLNAESKDPYDWNGTSYNYEARYKVNMLAVKLLGGNMVYPSTVIIPVKGEPEVLKGAFTAKELEMILKYYGDGVNETKSPEEYMKTFSGKWK